MHKVIHIFPLLKGAELALQDVILVGVMLLAVGAAPVVTLELQVLSPLWHSSCPCR